MKALKALEKYLRGVGIDCSDASSFDLSNDYPPAIAARYDAMCITLFGLPRIVIEPKTECPPDELIAAYRQLAAANKPVVALEFADREYSGFLQKAKVNYIVPGRQIYLPPCAVLTPPEGYERYEKLFLREKLSPWAQLVFLRLLLNHVKGESVAYSDLQEKLSISCVNLTRACQELEYHQLAKLSKEGRLRFITLPSDRRLLWSSAEKCLRSPVLKCFRYTGKLPSAPITGYPALVAASDLVPDDMKVVALSQAEAKKLDATKIQKYSGTTVEVWRYDPQLLANNGCVDPLSLYLSLKGSPDARVQIAINDLLEKVL